MGIWTMAIPGMNPLTGLLAGVTAVALGARAGFALGGVALVLTAVLGWRALADGRGGDGSSSSAEPDSVPHQLPADELVLLTPRVDPVRNEPQVDVLGS